MSRSQSFIWRNVDGGMIITEVRWPRRWRLIRMNQPMKLFRDTSRYGPQSDVTTPADSIKSKSKDLTSRLHESPMFCWLVPWKYVTNKSQSCLLKKRFICRVSGVLWFCRVWRQQEKSGRTLSASPRTVQDRLRLCHSCRCFEMCVCLESSRTGPVQILSNEENAGEIFSVCTICA